MSGIDSIKLNNITFSGKKKVRSAEKEQDIDNKGLKQIIFKPVKDKFVKAYGEDAKPTAPLIADFAADNIIKLGVLTAGTVVLFSKMKSTTNGLTKAVREAVKTHQGLGKKVGDVVNQVKKNNAEFVISTRKAAENAAKKGADGELLQSVNESGGVKTFVKSTLKNMFKPKETFNADGKLGKIIKGVVGEKKAPVVMDKLRKVGISGGSDLIDTTAAVAATGIFGSGLNNITNEVTSSDNEKLAAKSKVQTIRNSIDTIESLARAGEIIGA